MKVDIIKLLTLKIAKYREKNYGERKIKLKILILAIKNLFKKTYKIPSIEDCKIYLSGFENFTYLVEVISQKKYFFYIFRNDKLIDVEELRDLNTYYSNFPSDSIIKFDIDEAINSGVKKIGFVFFMGIGDYMYATPLFRQLKETYPKIEFNAYVSSKSDRNNSRPVFDLLKTNPIFSRVTYYKGKPAKYWMNYDFSDALKYKEHDEVLLPVIYEHNENVQSRYSALCNTFMLTELNCPSYPIIYSQDMNEYCTEIFNRVVTSFAKKIVWLQLEARSSNYRYPYSNGLLSKLLENNFIVITPDPVVGLSNNNLIVLDRDKTKINDSINLANHLANVHTKDLFFLGVISCFASISSGLRKPNLILQHFYDPCIKSVYFSNLFICTPIEYKNLPRDRQFVFDRGTYDISYSKGKEFFDYHVDKVIKYFNSMIDIYYNLTK